MAKAKNELTRGSEIQAIGTVHEALRDLDQGAQLRVLRYVAEMLGIKFESTVDRGQATRTEDRSEESTTAVNRTESQATDDFEGVSPVAVKWIKRADLRAKDLQTLFSLGADEIDLIAKKVPGTGKKDRMRSVLLLKGIAAYLGSGAARVTFEQVKEACLHYNAYDGSNFAAYLKSLAPEVSGTKEAGFTLTARGLNSATELVKEIVAAKS